MSVRLTPGRPPETIESMISLDSIGMYWTTQ